MVVFGNMAFQIADNLSQGIDAALVEGVSSLPGDETSGLLQKLRRLYFRNVDVMESYLVRNIFTLDNVSEKNRVLQAILAGDIDCTKENVTRKHVNTTTSGVEITHFDYPNKSEIPSPQELQLLQEDVSQKRALLRAARRRRNDLYQKLENLTSAHQAVQGVSESLVEATPNHDSIKEVVMSKERLETLQVSALELVKKLEEEKRNRHDEEEVDVSTKKQKLTLYEQYKEQRNVTKTLGSLTKVTKKLQK